jgi:hypothetical protein
VGGEGDVDAPAIDKAISVLLKDKPYLAAHGATPGVAEGGPQSSSLEPGADFNSMIRQAAGG